MTKNRKLQSAATRWGPLLMASMLFGFSVLASLGFIWHRNRNEQLSRQIRNKQVVLEGLRMQNQSLDKQLEDSRSHRALEQRVQELGLGLAMPQPEQILRVAAGAPAGANPTTSPSRLMARAPERQSH